MPNISFKDDIFPSELKWSSIRPLIKKAQINPEIYKNYRPVSNLLYISKIIERLVASQIIEHLDNDNLWEPLQSAYRKYHSTETALTKVHNDIMNMLDSGNDVCLMLLDLSAAFDTIDRILLITTLEYKIEFDHSCRIIIKQ